jgi:hypothetical protein
VPPISSDPHAWLRLIYARLRNAPPFALLSPHHQFDALCKAAAEISPSKVALMRQYKHDDTGRTVRLMEGVTFRRTQLVRDAAASIALSNGWQAALIERGWNSGVIGPTNSWTISS